MRRNFKCAAILCLVATVLCAAILFAACDPLKDGKQPDGNATTYEVKILLTDGSPAAGARVSFVEIEDGKSNSSVDATTDAQGVASYTSESGNAVDATLKDVPAGYKIPEDKGTLRLTKDSPNATVTLERVQSDLPDLEYGEPLSGKGTARYVSAGSTQLDSLSFDPYVVIEGNYKFKFQTATQRIYLQFDSRNSQSALYLIYSRGEVDASVQAIVGTTIGGLYNPTRTGHDNDGRPQFNDNKTAQDKNFELEFSNNESATMGYSAPGEFYFELALEDPTDMGLEFAVTVEKLDKPYVPKPPTVYTDIHADPAPQKAGNGQGAINAIPTLCGNFVVAKAEDGTYHLGGETGPLLYANLDGAWPCGATLQGGQPMTCISRISGGTNPYKWADPDGVNGENWLPFLCEYVGYVIDSDGTSVAPGGTNENTGFVNNGATKCNSDGYYPVNEQIVEFLTNLYYDLEIQNFYFTPDNYMGTIWDLPKGYEWIFLCGYYGETYEGSDFGGTGSESDPFTVLKQGVFDIEIPAGGRVYFSVGLAYKFFSATEGAALEYNGKEYGTDGHGFELTVTKGGTQNAIVSLYFISGEAGTVALNIEYAMQGNGSKEEPYQLGETDEYADTVAARSEVYYEASLSGGNYTVTAEGATAYIYDLDGYLALISGDEATPVFTKAGTNASGQIELEEGYYYILIVNESGNAIEWAMTRGE